MLKSIAFLSAALIAASVPAIAQSQAPAASQPQARQQPQQPSNAQPKLDPNRRICVTEDIIGSRTGGTKICKTAEQWARERQQGSGEPQ